MTVSWDLYAKDLLKERPQDFAELILPGSRYIRRHESQYQMREIRLDRLIEVEYKGRRILINVEIQASRDHKMGIRLLRYSLEAMEEYSLPVLSCVIYLQKGGKSSKPPLCVDLLPDEWRLLWFNYISIELAKKTTKDLRQMNLLGLLPLFILSKGGKNFEVLDEVVTRLQDANEHELLILTRLFAEAAFTSVEERAQLFRRFAMLQDIENTPTYQRLTRKGEILGTRRNIEAVTEARFPSLLKLTQTQIALLTDLTKLQEILLKVSTARTAKEIKEYLLALPGQRDGE